MSTLCASDLCVVLQAKVYSIIIIAISCMMISVTGPICLITCHNEIMTATCANPHIPCYMHVHCVCVNTLLCLFGLFSLLCFLLSVSVSFSLSFTLSLSSLSASLCLFLCFLSLFLFLSVFLACTLCHVLFGFCYLLPMHAHVHKQLLNDDSNNYESCVYRPVSVYGSHGNTSPVKGNMTGTVHQQHLLI